MDQLTDEIKFISRGFDGPFGTIDVLDSLNNFHVERRIHVSITYPAVQRRLLKLIEIGWLKSKQIKAGGRGALGIDSTPTVFINGRTIKGALDAQRLADAVALARVKP